ncbi:MAG: hypothetical protein R3F20_07955 [Planctomycetota bacterium]
MPVRLLLALLLVAAASGRAQDGSDAPRARIALLRVILEESSEKAGPDPASLPGLRLETEVVELALGESLERHLPSFDFKVHFRRRGDRASVSIEDERRFRRRRREFMREVDPDPDGRGGGRYRLGSIRGFEWGPAFGESESREVVLYSIEIPGEPAWESGVEIAAPSDLLRAARLGFEAAPGLRSARALLEFAAFLPLTVPGGPSPAEARDLIARAAETLGRESELGAALEELAAIGGESMLEAIRGEGRDAETLAEQALLRSGLVEGLESWENALADQDRSWPSPEQMRLYRCFALAGDGLPESARALALARLVARDDSVEHVDRWIRALDREELGLSPATRDPLRARLETMVAGRRLSELFGLVIGGVLVFLAICLAMRLLARRLLF